VDIGTGLTPMEACRRREICARAVIVVGLILLGAGTVGGSSPTVPDDMVYAIASWLTAGLWMVTMFQHRDRALKEIADAALLALAIMRAGGYVYDYVNTGRQGFLAAIAAWVIIAALSARPLRSHRG
jgi:hypothetical protein